MHKHEPRRGSASPPQRTAGSEVDAEGLYVDIHGAAYAPKGRASRAELERSHRAELARRHDCKTKSNSSARGSRYSSGGSDREPRARNPWSPTSKHEHKHSKSQQPPRRRRRADCPRAAPVTMGAPLQTPCTTFPAGESSPARPSSERLQARPRASPVGRPGSRSTARRPPVAAVGPGSKPSSPPTPPRAFRKNRNPRALARPEGPTSESCFELGCFVLGWVGCGLGHSGKGV